MRKCYTALLVLSSLLFFPLVGKAQQPSVEVFKKTFEAQLQKLLPQGFTKRTVLFVKVVPGKSNSGYYPFQVWANIHDYAPGYPKNRYYGQSCLGKMEGWKFDMRKDDFGNWLVQGRFTVTDTRICKENPSEGQEAITLASVPGSPYKKSNAPAAIEINKTTSASLYIGEYACYGTGGTLLAGMGFKLLPNGKYVDLDQKRGGSYVYNAKNATINFNGGFLGGQAGKNVKLSGFQLSNTVYAEPWR